MRRLKPLDLVILLFGIGISVYSFISLSPAGEASGMVVTGEQGTWVYPAKTGGEALRVSVQGPLGDTVLEINDGQARIISSPCLNQTCVAAGAIHRRGAFIACLPNRVMVSVEGGEDENLDASSW
ncbi:MAG: NusG domain II-containing protein [Treponema sp.]|nr:NusG domain II-containing protein [Treponema sp.]